MTDGRHAVAEETSLELHRSDAPRELLVSADVDLYPRHHPERADLIEGSIGERGRISQQIEAD